jgi:hypothetical protein
VVVKVLCHNLCVLVQAMQELGKNRLFSCLPYAKFIKD